MVQGDHPHPVRAGGGCGGLAIRLPQIAGKAQAGSVKGVIPTLPRWLFGDKEVLNLRLMCVDDSSGLRLLISFAEEDRTHARWVASIFDAAGCTTTLRKIISPFHSFLPQTKAALVHTDHVIALLSPHYQERDAALNELYAALRSAGPGKTRRLIPVRILQCDIPTVNNYFDFVDLVDKDEPTARDLLLGAVHPYSLRRPMFFPWRRTTLGTVPESGDDSRLDPSFPASPGSGGKACVFVSYSHKDRKIQEQLQKHLAVLLAEDLIDTWADTRIRAGQNWFQEIDRAIARARVAVLLVSVDFLTSDFVLHEEIPKLLARRANKDFWLIPIIVDHCAWDKASWLAPLQAVTEFGKPVMGTATRGRHFAQIARQVADFVTMR